MLVKQESLQNYFHDFLKTSLCKQNIQAQDHTINYLTHLLVTFSRTEKFIDPAQGRASHKPLALYYSDAVNSPSSHKRDLALRRLGDIALFVCGVFSNSLEKKAIDVDYYIAMGGSAYGYLSESSSSSKNTLPHKNIFNELSDRFVDFVDVLSDLNESQNNSNKNLLRTYELWLNTHSKRAKSILIENGIQPIDQNSPIQ